MPEFGKNWGRYFLNKAKFLRRITILIPLLEEPRILHHLLYHLQKLDYPRTHLEVMLILEDGDVETQTALLATELPSWCCVITVPKGRVKTKPRALNFAFGFSSGDIIGVLDAEDAPEKRSAFKSCQPVRYGRSPSRLPSRAFGFLQRA